MLLINTAYKNIVRSGRRTLLNVSVLSLVLVIMLAYNGLLDGWFDESRREMRKWETAEGQYWHPEYQYGDMFSLQDAHGLPPAVLDAEVAVGHATAILAVQASIYPQGRMQNICLRGIDPQQSVIELPSRKLQEDNGDAIHAIIGVRMARAARLQEGDRVMMRWRDKDGAFDAREIIIDHIFTSRRSALDQMQVWISLQSLREITGLEGEASYVVSAGKSQPLPAEDWVFRSPAYLMADLDSMMLAARIEGALVSIILLILALLTIFDTQTLSIFRRQREIGTYVALGMRPKAVMWLFTLEGTMYSVLAIFMTAVCGSPLLWLLAYLGIPLPASLGHVGLVGNARLIPYYKPSSVLVILAVVVLMSALISFLPTRKIARQDMLQALKGKIT
jgi:ABC-type transport system, involved in lipoprotein release, permease component